MNVDKQSIRSHFRTLRNNLPLEERSAKAARMVELLQNWLHLQPFSQIFGYFAYQSEPNLYPLYENLSTKVGLAFPITKEDNTMDFYLWRHGDSLNKSKFGICEPLANADQLCLPLNKPLILVPALAADMSGHRLGYGAGFYDRYLSKFSQVVTMAVVYSPCLVAELPKEEHDIPVHHVLTEQKIWNCR